MVSCKKVLAELSNYIDGDLEPGLRKQTENHIRWHHRCSVLADSTRKMLYIVGDERIFEVSDGYSDRLHQFLATNLDTE